MSNMIDRPVQIRLEFHWQPLGQVRSDEEGRLQFPSAPRRPGLYRFRLSGNGPGRHYVGETEELRRRFRHYRAPGPTQQTNIRMNAEFADHLSGGGCIEVDIVTGEITVLVAGAPIQVDLAGKAMRRLLEHAALVDEAASGVKLLNR